MTQGVIAPEFESFGAVELGWREHKFRGNAGTVWDTGPSASEEPSLTVMICGHADKIRMQVRSISADGKVWIQSDSFLPLTLLGNQVTLFSEDPAALGTYRQLPGTIEALGAIHFAPPESRSGKKGIGPEEVYLELGLHGSQRKEQLDQLGVRPGDTILLNRPIERCVGGDTFSGAYLDNGLGCFVAAEVARKVAASPELTKHCRCLFAFASHEEIGAADDCQVRHRASLELTKHCPFGCCHRSIWVKSIGTRTPTRRLDCEIVNCLPKVVELHCVRWIYCHNHSCLEVNGALMVFVHGVGSCLAGCGRESRL